MGNSRELSLQLLKDYRDEILKAEIGALLFNLGKTHIGFWRKKEEKEYFQVDENSFENIYEFNPFNDYRLYFSNSVFEHELELYNLKNFVVSEKLKFPFKVKGEKELEWIELFKGGASKEDFIKKVFFRGCENINSGIDKGSPNKQLEPPLWLSSASGSFKKKIEKRDFDKSRLCFFSNLARFLNKNNYPQNLNWMKIRDFILKEIKDWYSGLLSDSRFPVNDVSLWDQAYMTASMFKAVLSQLVMDKKLEDKDIETDSYFTSPSSIKWRILGIQYNKLGLAEKGFKLASIGWYRNAVKEIDDTIKNLLEVKYPIGNEIYRDETGIYFIVGEDLGKDNGDFAELVKKLQEIENKIIDIFETNLEGEAYPTIILTKASRGLMNLGYLIEKTKENFLKRKIIKVKKFEFDEVEHRRKKYKVKKDKNWAEIEKDDGTKEKIPNSPIGICPLCKTRLIYEEDKQKNNSPTICEVCNKRVHHKQVEKWILNPGSETIWTGEIKDKNDKIALISLKFELQDWLNGNLLNSLLVNKCNWNTFLGSLINDLKTNNGRRKKLKNTIIKDLVDKSLRKRLELQGLVVNTLLERSMGHEWEKFIKNNLSNQNLIDFKSRTIDWKKLTDNDIEFLATLLLQFLFRKNPSPARLRRIWETTQEFFENIKRGVLDDNKLKIPDWRRKRIVFEVDYTEELKKKIKETGEELEGSGILFWAQPEGEKLEIYLITSIEDFIEKFGEKEILRKIENNEDFKLNIGSFKDFEIELRRYSEKKNKGEGKAILTIKKDNVKEFQDYKPYASIIDPAPVGWQVIIPAEYVPDVIDSVLERYNRSFKYVYGKLPLHIGIVIQDYKKPLYVGINALRRIRRDVKNTDKLWISEDANRFCLKQKKKFSSATPEELCNRTEDYYSLYWENSNGNGYLFYIKPGDSWKKWVSTLDNFNSTDKVEYIPNTFDFEFLDTNTRRNDIYYVSDRNCKRAKKLKANRPYELEEHWEKFKIFKEIFTDRTSSSKLHNLISLLYSKLEDFTESYAYLLSSAFVNIFELKKNKELRDGIFSIFGAGSFEEFTEKLKRKENILLFLDMFEFWHTALKEV